jgi:hypothetical protein
MKWAGHLACMGERSGLCSGVEGRHERKRPLENQSVEGKIILKWIFKKWHGARTGLKWLKIGTDDGLWNALIHLRFS